MAIINSLDNHYYLCWTFQQEHLSKIRVNHERGKTGLTGYKPLSAGRNTDASDQTGVTAVHLWDTNTSNINTSCRNSREEKQTVRDHSRTRSGLYYFTLVHYHQTYLVDLFIFLFFFNPVQKNDRQTLLHVCSFTAQSTISTTKIFAFWSFSPTRYSK